MEALALKGQADLLFLFTLAFLLFFFFIN